MTFKVLKKSLLAGVSVATLALASPVAAGENETGLFADFGAGASFRSATSDTRNGGAFNNGRVEDIDFDTALAVGGRIGYQFSSALGVFLSYDYVGGDARWFASYTGFADRSRFDAQAQSHVVLANLSYTMDMTSATSLSAVAGLGLAVNRLSDIEESSEATGIKFAEVASKTNTGFAAHGGVEVNHALSEAFAVKLGASLDYYGSFKTGDTRTVGTTKQSIGAYELDNAWGATLMARATYRF